MSTISLIDMRTTMPVAAMETLRHFSTSSAEVCWGGGKERERGGGERGKY